LSKVPEFAAFDNDDACGKDFVSKANLEDHVRTAHLGLPSRINANRKKSAPSSDDDEDEVSEFDFGEESKQKSRKAKGKKAKSSAIDDLLGLSYANDSRRNIPCLITTCHHLFMRDYDLQQHMRTKHSLSTPEIEVLAKENEDEPEFQFPPGDFRNDDAYGEDGREEDMDWDIGMQGLEDLPFWLGGNEEETPMDQWTQDEFEMRRLIGGEEMGGNFGTEL
jgi:general transcription factor IIIA